jgi:hypothetical protein
MFIRIEIKEHRSLLKSNSDRNEFVAEKNVYIWGIRVKHMKDTLTYDESRQTDRESAGFKHKYSNQTNI